MAKFDPQQKAKEGAIQGRPYLNVKWRVVWFRQEHPDYSVTTELIQVQPFIIVRARVIDPEGREIASGYGSAPEHGGGRSTWKGRELEKAETAAIGRALSLFGYGTEFTDDFDEGDHLADAPQEQPGPRPVDNPAQPKAEHKPAKASGPRYEYEPVINHAMKFVVNRDDAIEALKDMKKNGLIRDSMTTDEVNAAVREKLRPPMSDDEVAAAFEDLGKTG